MSISKPPVKPGKNATQKALEAYASELRRYATRLREWEQKLDRHEAELDDREAELAVLEGEDESGYINRESFNEDEDCECTPEDAIDGCPCPTCEEWREEHPATHAHELWRKSIAPVTAGDEVKFLENLYTLKDKRGVSKHTKAPTQ